ncbi:MAG: hypothetical protein K9N38_12040 [Candidatus Marinimicrobia bacterium]|nr:hypothetical protein [Candidatus Neomarinimicrobiota bacterium]MCF7851569.1 hypothetical protein [Candidatus Neomarinimicrobiota bacterium]
MLKENPEVDLWGDKDFGAWFEMTVEKFLAASDNEFECADIVGRKFQGISDHSKHLHEGGCYKIIDTLASSLE